MSKQRHKLCHWVFITSPELRRGPGGEFKWMGLAPENGWREGREDQELREVPLGDWAADQVNALPGKPTEEST